MRQALLAIWTFLTAWLTPTTPNEPAKTADTSPGYTITEVARGLEVPWSIAFTDSNRLLVTERKGAIREIKDGVLNPRSLVSLEQTYNQSEAGLMGLAVDPNYVANKYLYICMTRKVDQVIENIVMRLIDYGSEITPNKVILASIPGANVHVGCRLRFGPDGKLYITTGDATQKSLAQKQDSLAGKILRMNSDGTDLEVYSMGHRNPQGLAWNSQGQLWETEHGPSGFDGPGGGDEVNVIVKGGNYGWPLVSHEKAQAGLLAPKLVFTPAIAPSGAAFLNDVFYFATLRGQAIYKVTPDFKYEKLPDITFGRIRDVVAGPDGSLYFTTSNRDGRGIPQAGDDKIYQITF